MAGWPLLRSLPPRDPDLSAVHIRAGDFTVDELSAAMSNTVIIRAAVSEAKGGAVALVLRGPPLPLSPLFSLAARTGVFSRVCPVRRKTRGPAGGVRDNARALASGQYLRPGSARCFALCILR
jgi:hypothetical protein